MTFEGMGVEELVLQEFFFSLASGADNVLGQSVHGHSCCIMIFLSVKFAGNFFSQIFPTPPAPLPSKVKWSAGLSIFSVTCDQVIFSGAMQMKMVVFTS